MNRYFITGTDTDCGKTYVTCQMLNYLQKEGKRVLAIKPVASGCLEVDGQLVSEDSLLLNKQNENSDLDITPWRFKQPISPHLAAAQQGEVMSAAAIANFCTEENFANLDYLLIEGAGGLMVPLNQDETWLDFLINSQISVIIVVGMRLGCLNHALLTVQVLSTYEIPCKGWIANCIDKDMLALQENITTLMSKINVPLLGTIYHGESLIHMHEI